MQSWFMAGRNTLPDFPDKSFQLAVEVNDISTVSRVLMERNSLGFSG